MYFLYPLQLNYKVTNKQLPYGTVALRKTKLLTSHSGLNFEHLSSDYYFGTISWVLASLCQMDILPISFIKQLGRQRSTFHLSSAHMNISLHEHNILFYVHMTAHEITGPHSSICPTFQAYMQSLLPDPVYPKPGLPTTLICLVYQKLCISFNSHQ